MGFCKAGHSRSQPILPNLALPRSWLVGLLFVVDVTQAVISYPGADETVAGLHVAPGTQSGFDAIFIELTQNLDFASPQFFYVE